MSEITVHTSDLEKVWDVLKTATKHHKARDEMNAALHLADTPRYSPLTSELEAAWERVDALLNEATLQGDAQREHCPTDKCPDPDCACAQEAASLHVQVSRLESRLDSTRGELERTRERLREAERERDEWRREVKLLLRWLNEQAKATMDAHRNFRSSYDEGRFDAFGAVEAHIEGRDTNE